MPQAVISDHEVLIGGRLFSSRQVNDRILVVGCGNSTLSADLFDVGFKQMVNIDISDVVIAQMRQSRPEMTFEKMDVTDMTGFTDQSFTCVLDKGTLDAIFTDDQRDDVIRTVDKMFQVWLRKTLMLANVCPRC